MHSNFMLINAIMVKCVLCICIIIFYNTSFTLYNYINYILQCAILFAYFLKHVHALVPGNHIHGTWPQPMSSENQFKEQNLSYAKI